MLQTPVTSAPNALAICTAKVPTPLGESREEYVARKVSADRRAAETAYTFLRVTQEAGDSADDLLVAVDQELAGICRLHELVPHFPPAQELASHDAASIEEISGSVATAAKGLGVNCFLAPILDIVSGQNPWLSGRTWSTDPDLVARLSSAYIRGVQAAGVVATAKHFPGFHTIALDPAIEPGAIVTERASSFKPGFIPFADAIGNKVEMIMVGPAIVQAFDTEKPASISPKIIGMLRCEFGFRVGLILTLLVKTSEVSGHSLTDAEDTVLAARFCRARTSQGLGGLGDSLRKRHWDYPCWCKRRRSNFRLRPPRTPNPPNAMTEA